MLSEVFYIIVMGKDDKMLGRYLFQGFGFPAQSDVEDALDEVSTMLNQHPDTLTAKIDKRYTKVPS